MCAPIGVHMLCPRRQWKCLARTWAEEMRTTSLRVNVLNPGPIATRMRRQAMPGEDQSTLPTPEELARAALPLFGSETDSCGEIYDFRAGKLVAKGVAK
jgi:NAD(P)-dependent dehydrogenase (short-subunit alcohol dehydrogenase family)